MSRPSAPVRLPLTTVRDLAWSPSRRGEPVTFGVPLPRGLVRAASDLGLEGPSGPQPLQARAVDQWPDGSVRWVLLSFAADASPGQPSACTLVVHPAGEPVRGLEIFDEGGTLRVETGRTTFEWRTGAVFPISQVTSRGAGPARTATLTIGHQGRQARVSVAAFAVHERGPLMAEVEIRGRIDNLPGLTLDATATIALTVGQPTARLHIALHNPRRAAHRGGQWGLGDSGSVLLDFAVLSVGLGAPLQRVQAAVEWGQPLQPADPPFEVFQASSGGDHWDSPAHRNRDGRVPLEFRGYRATSGGGTRSGWRASPIVHVACGVDETAVTLPQFWEQCPKAVRVDETTIAVGLFPEQHGDVHELQGGERKTHEVVLAFGRDPVSDPPLAWVHDPLLFAPDPAWTCATDAVPFLSPAVAGDPAYAALTAEAHDAHDGFLAKRETADEYGWRHFGDIPADHESAFQPPDRPFVSHYNNQYDAIAAFALHFLRSADPRWWRLMHDLARHVRDVDIYRTTEDKSAYNGGLFWHTAHYLDAGISTHRTYPPGTNVSGGPSAEHNYNLGLMYHYFLTGERASREAAIGLGEWVIRMDDGRRTPFRWLASGPTGHASLTRDYHGPGRGAGHSILACLVAARLTGDARFTDKADELIARVVNPADDIDAHGLLDAERRWSYTAFLQVLGVYLHDKLERDEQDAAFRYAQASLRHYAQWMVGHERLYLDHPEALEYPTETWAAQELRKADVLLWAAMHARDAERQRCLERARFFYDAAVRSLANRSERRFTRPLVLVLSQGLRLDWWIGQQRDPPRQPIAEQERGFEPRRSFVPQRAQALRRVVGLAALAGVGLALLALWRLSA